MRGPPTQSQISRSATATEKNDINKNSLIAGTTELMDRLFPLFDQMTQHSYLPTMVNLIVDIVCFVQIFTISAFTFHPFYYNIQGTFKKVVSAFHSLVYFCPFNPNHNDLIIEFSIIFAISILILIFYAFELVYFSYKHRFIKWTLYIIRIAIEVISPVFIIASAGTFSNLLNAYLSSWSTLYLVLCILSFAALVNYYFVYYIGMTLITRSCCIRKHNTSSFDASIQVSLLSMNVILIIATNIFARLEYWTYIFLFLVHALVISFLFRKIETFSFHTTAGAVEFHATIIVQILSDVLMAIVSTFAMKQTPAFIPFITPYIFLLIAAPISYFLYRRKVNIILNALNCEEELSPDQKRDFFANLDLIDYPKKLITYLRLSFLHRNHVFTDFSFPHYCVQASIGTDAAFDCMQIISFFPSESRSLNMLFRKSVGMRQISLANRFLIFQVNKVKTIRQSSVSSAANDRMMELKTMSKQCEDLVKSFWASYNVSYGYLELMHSKILMVESMWEEGLRDYPNNPKFSDEFAVFLCEGKADFEKAIKQKYRSEMVSNGTNFSVDIPYKSLIKSFPDFLREGILDIHGNFLKKATNARGSQVSSTSTGSTGFSTTSSAEIEIDAEIEDSIGKQLISQSRLRMAFQRSIDSKSSTPIRALPISSFLLVILTVIILSIMAILTVREFSFQRDSSSRYYVLSRLSSGNSLIMSSLILSTANAVHAIESLPTFPEDPEDIPNLFDLDNIKEVTNNFTRSQSDNLVLFLEKISKMASEGYGVYKIAEGLFAPKSSFTFCHKKDGKILRNNPILTNMKNIQAFQIYSQQKLSDLDNAEDMIFQEEFCALSSNFQEYEGALRSLFETFSKTQVENAEVLNKNVIFYNGVEICAVVILLIIASSSTYIIHLIQIKKLTKSLLRVEAETKQNAMKPIVNGISEETDKITEAPSQMSSCLFITVVNVFLAASFVVIVVLTLFNAKDTSKKISNINAWLVQSAYRTSSTVNTLFGILTSILLGAVDLTYTDQEKYLNFTNSVFDVLDRSNSALLDGNDEIPSIFGFDDEIDRLNIKDSCKHNDTDSHGMYMCMSLSKQISVFKDYIVHVRSHIKEYSNFNSPIILNMIHLVSSHMFNNMYLTDLRLGEITEEVYLHMRTKMVIYVAASIVLGVFSIVFLTTYVLYTMKNQFNALMILIKHMNPLDVMANKEITNFLLNKSTANKESGMCVAESVIHNSNEGIFGANINSIIEIVNPAISDMLGYTPEHLLGQPISTLFTDADAPNVAKKMEMMKNGECSTVLEDRVSCITDNSNIITCHMLMLGMQKGDSSSISSFVFILRDESDLIKQQQAVEAAKASSEKLLFQILPRDIVVRLNSGEKDISFAVPSASIIFIDVVKFSEYASSLSPQEIMGNLSLIFETFDNIIAKYTQMTKIKLIGDVYMAAGGLFAPAEQDPKIHAEEVVKFAIDCEHELDDVNVKLNASLCVRIGINSGGPIIAGVLGTDRPVFDIIGDPINIAARLQSTDIPGRIQISQATKDLISDGDFQIDQRGEVYLKGKGKSMTYFVDRANGLLMLST